MFSSFSIDIAVLYFLFLFDPVSVELREGWQQDRGWGNSRFTSFLFCQCEEGIVFISRHLFLFVFTFFLSCLTLSCFNRALTFNPFLPFSPLCRLPNCLSQRNILKDVLHPVCSETSLLFPYLLQASFTHCFVAKSQASFQQFSFQMGPFLLGRDSGCCCLSLPPLTSWHFREAPAIFPTQGQLQYLLCWSLVFTPLPSDKFVFIAILCLLLILQV